MEYLCRICLTTNATEVLSLFDDMNNNLCNRVMLCTNIKLYPVKGLPKEICKHCLDDLNVADNFRLKCKNSDDLLRNNYSMLFLEKNEIDLKKLGPLNDSFNATTNSELNKKNNLDTIILNKTDERLSHDEEIHSEDKQCDVKIKEEITEYPESLDLFEDHLSYNYRKEKDSNRNLKKNRIRLKNNNCVNDLVQRGKKRKIDKAVESENLSDYENKKIWMCEECGKSLSKRCVLIKHIKVMHSTSRKVSLMNSRKTGHGKNKRFHCPLCPFVTKFSQTLVYHERTHTGERPHVCPHCNRSFSHPGNLSTHLTTHSDQTHFKCEICNREFKTKSIYVRHRGIHDENRKVYSCDLCGAKLKAKQALENHMKRHKNIKNYSCEMCGYRFVTLEELINHSKKHNTEKKYKCDICDFRTALKRSLQTHVKRHLNPRAFKCKSCDLACFTKYELANHEKTHTRECNYSCMMCERKFIQSSSLNKHVQRTHGVKIKRDGNIDRRKVK